MQTAECGFWSTTTNRASPPPTKAELKPSASIRQREQESRGFATLIQEQRRDHGGGGGCVAMGRGGPGRSAAATPPAPLFAAWLPSKYILTSVGSAPRSATVSTPEMAAGSDRPRLRPLAARGRPPAPVAKCDDVHTHQKTHSNGRSSRRGRRAVLKAPRPPRSKHFHIKKRFTRGAAVWHRKAGEVDIL